MIRNNIWSNTKTPRETWPAANQKVIILREIYLTKNQKNIFSVVIWEDLALGHNSAFDIISFVWDISSRVLMGELNTKRNSKRLRSLNSNVLVISYTWARWIPNSNLLLKNPPHYSTADRLGHFYHVLDWYTSEFWYNVLHKTSHFILSFSIFFRVIDVWMYVDKHCRLSFIVYRSQVFSNTKVLQRFSANRCQVHRITCIIFAFVYLVELQSLSKPYGLILLYESNNCRQY